MRRGYFDSDGNLLLIAEWTSVMGDPPEMAFVAEVSEEATANNVYFAYAKVHFKQPFTVTVSRNLIAGIPAGTLVTDSLGSVEVDDGAAEYVADVPSVEWVQLSHPHFLYQVVEVETGP